MDFSKIDLPMIVMLIFMLMVMVRYRACFILAKPL